MTFKRLVLALNFLVVVFVVGYLYATGGPIPGGHFPEEGTYLFQEKMFGTLFSSFQIAAIGFVALLNAIFCLSQNRKHEVLFWGLSIFAFIFFALDEYFLIHENIDFWIIRVCGLPENRLTDRIDDVLVLIYGLMGLYVLKKSWPWLREYKGFVKYVKVGFVLLFLMVLYDLARIKMTPVKELEEDALKLFAEAYFLIAYFSCLRKKDLPQGNPSIQENEKFSSDVSS